MDQLKFNSFEEAKAYFRISASEHYENILLRRGIDLKNLQNWDVDKLKKAKIDLFEFLDNKSMVSQISARFFRQYNYIIFPSTGVLYPLPYTLREYISELLDLISDKINYLEQTAKVLQIKNLVEELPENDVKEKLSLEIKELEAKKVELEINKASERERLQEEIEYGKHKAEMFVKKTDVFLKFLDRESVASIVGSLLLLTMGVCLIVMMFRHEEPLKIIESAFLLILGYFFGHSKNNK